MRSITTAIGIVSMLALSGCGSDDDSASNDIEATASEWQFEPSEWEIDAGEFTIDFTNSGANEHEWAVMKIGDEIQSEADFTSEDQVLLEVEAVPPGERTTETFTIDERGTYQVVCLIEGHFDQGMGGALLVG